jgi:hypothetical protein
MSDAAMPSRGERARVRVLIALAVTAAAIRLIPLALLHPLQWDEVEYFRASDWVRRGLVPFRDFWEHHTPLHWYLFAPFTALTDSPGVDAIVTMRWAQVPLWIATFWLIGSWARRAGAGGVATWGALASVLASSMFMTPAIEFRVDTTAAALYVGGLWCAQRMHERRAYAVVAGVLFCLTGFANIRFGPLLAATALLLRVTDLRERRWRDNTRANWLIGAVLMTLAAALLFLTVTRSLHPMIESVWRENVISDREAEGVRFGFLHRILLPSGIRILGGPAPSFDPAGIDVGGLAIVIVGVVGIALALRRWRTPDDFFVLAVLQVIGVIVIARMKFIYHYHLELAVLMMLPLLALAFESLRWRRALVMIAVAAWGVNLFASVFRGKEADRAYQALIMSEAHHRTSPGDKVWDGVGWAVRREPAYRYWFLPDLVRHLVRLGHAEPYTVRELLSDPPGVVIADQNAIVWLSTQPELRAAMVRHYLPVWRNLWIPALSARLDATTPATAWIVPRDGVYRVYASAELAAHPWFERPLYVASYFGPGASRSELQLGRPAGSALIAWHLDGQPLPAADTLRLRKGQRLDARAEETLGVLVVPGTDQRLFRQPPENVTLDGAAPRVTHWPEW